MSEILLAFLNEDISFIESLCQKKMLEKIGQGWEINIMKSYYPIGKYCDPIGSIFDEPEYKSISQLIKILSAPNLDCMKFITECYWSILRGIDGIDYSAGKINAFIDLGKRLRQYAFEIQKDK